MALTNKGFDGTFTEQHYALMQALGPNGVESAAAWAVTQGTGRQVSVAAQAGWACQSGVISKDTAALTAALTTPTNGQWFLIVRRVDWTIDTVTVEAVPHTTTSTTVPTAPPTTIPTTESTPGVKEDQPLAWAWVRSTDTTMVIFDRRTRRRDGYEYRIIGTTLVLWSTPWIAYTPTLTAAGGALGAISNLSGSYRYVGGSLDVKGAAQVAQGSGTGQIRVTLPDAQASTADDNGQSYNVSVGRQGSAVITSGQNFLALARYDNVFPLDTGSTQFIRWGISSLRVTALVA